MYMEHILHLWFRRAASWFCMLKGMCEFPKVLWNCTEYPKATAPGQTCNNELFVQCPEKNILQLKALSSDLAYQIL